jgi:hypothetical protein
MLDDDTHILIIKSRGRNVDVFWGNGWDLRVKVRVWEQVVL